MKTVYFENDCLNAIDQTALPYKENILELCTVKDICNAIYVLAIRGAPCIGVSGAFAIVLSAKEANSKDTKTVLEYMEKQAPIISDTRPTATNLSWAVKRMMEFAHSKVDLPFDEFYRVLIDLAQTISDEESENARKISLYGAEFVPDEGANILTHCNTGPLCTIEYGLSVGAAIMAYNQGKNVHVYTDETRPRMQGSKLNVYELKKYGVPFTLLTDNMAAYAMQQGLIDMVFVSADRVASNGDTAAKIGVYGVCVLAQKHGIPVFLHSPMSTIDFNIKSGAEIKVEQRDPQEVLNINGVQIAPPDTPVLNPSFDVTPHQYFNAIITENGVAYPPFTKSLKELRDK
jgi:methylthioribose-1-phosphate isomerase